MALAAGEDCSGLRGGADLQGIVGFEDRDDSRCAGMERSADGCGCPELIDDDGDSAGERGGIDVLRQEMDLDCARHYGHTVRCWVEETAV